MAPVDQPSPQPSPAGRGGLIADLSRPPVSARAVLLGLVLIPVNVVWVEHTECVTEAAMATMASLFFTAVFTLLVTVLANALLRRLRPAWALSAGELLTAYAMLCAATAVAGHDQVEVLVATTAHPYWFATSENQFAALLHPYLDRTLILRDHDLLAAFWSGHASLFGDRLLPAALPALLGWSGFAVGLYGAMLCLNLLFRPRWSQAEKLGYPLLQLPLQIAAAPGELFRGRLLWTGFGLAAAIDLWNGVSALCPAVPRLPVTAHDLAPQLTSPIGRALGYMPVSAYPWIIGLGYLLPVEYLLSCAVFFWVWKAELVYGALFARGGRFPYVAEQSAGAYLGIAIFAIWTARHHLRAVVSRQAETGVPRWVLPGLAACVAICLAYGHRLGMSWGVAGGFFALYFGVSLAVARARAEMGVPTHDLLGAGPDRAFVAWCGSAALGPHNLAAFATLMWFNRAQRSHPMPQQIEGLELAARQGASPNRAAAALMLACLAGFVTAFVTMLWLGCRHGFATVTTDASYFGSDAWLYMAARLSTPQHADPGVAAAMAFGAGITLLLLRLRTLFVWWPLHPIGYAVTSYFFGAILWVPLLVALIIKVSVLRAGGLKAYRKGIPLFVGLILGEFVVGGAWSIVGTVTGWHTYRFWAY